MDAGRPSRRIEAHTIAIPENACAVPLCKWLCPSLLERLNWPDSPDCELGDRGLLICSRSRAVAGLPQTNGTSSFAQSSAFRHRSTTTRTAGFAVANDHRDRFIGERRRQNEKERLIHRACLPHAPRLKQSCSRAATLFGSISEMFSTVSTFSMLTTSTSKGKSSVTRVPWDWFNDQGFLADHRP